VGGGDLAAGDKTALSDYFAALERALNVSLHLADPERVPVTIAATVRAEAGADQAALEDAVAAALTERVNPDTFDVDSKAPGGWARVRATELTVFDLSAAIDDLDGLASVVSITINGDTAPVALPAPVSLPDLTAPPTVTVV
jgi:hypothetical protein